MNTEEFIQKHKEMKRAVRTYIMLYVQSGLEHYLDAATTSFKTLKQAGETFKSVTGFCPMNTLFENHVKETEHRAKILEIGKVLEKANTAKIETTETETVYKHGKVTWKKGA